MIVTKVLLGGALRLESDRWDGLAKAHLSVDIVEVDRIAKFGSNVELGALELSVVLRGHLSLAILNFSKQGLLFALHLFENLWICCHDHPIELCLIKHEFILCTLEHFDCRLIIWPILIAQRAHILEQKTKLAWQTDRDIVGLQISLYRPDRLVDIRSTQIL